MGLGRMLETRCYQRITNCCFLVGSVFGGVTEVFVVLLMSCIVNEGGDVYY